MDSQSTLFPLRSCQLNNLLLTRIQWHSQPLVPSHFVSSRRNKTKNKLQKTQKTPTLRGILQDTRRPSTPSWFCPNSISTTLCACQAITHNSKRQGGRENLKNAPDRSRTPFDAKNSASHFRHKDRVHFASPLFQAVPQSSISPANEGAQKYISHGRSNFKTASFDLFSLSALLPSLQLTLYVH